MNDETKLWKNYKVGGTDVCGRKIDAIFSCYDNYIIYEAADTLLLDGDKKAVDQSPEIIDRLLKAMALAPLDAKRKRRLYRQLANALDQCLTGDKVGCMGSLESILTRLRNASIATARLHYIFSGLLCVVMCLVFAVCRSLVPLELVNPLWFKLTAFGAIGALFSVLLNQQKIPIDLDHSTLVHWTAGASRILVGVIASIGCYAAIKAEIILSMADKVPGYGVLFFCFLSGFSETFVPSLLKDKDSAPGKTP